MRASSRPFVVGLLFASCLVALSLQARAGKPSGGGGKDTVTSLPPVTPNYDLAAFELRPDLGGVLDKTRNVVWGYSVAGVENGAKTYEHALPANTWYAPMILNQAQAKQNDGNLLLSLAATETNPGRKAYYEATAAADFAAIQPLLDAGAIASQYNNWRVPTIAEVRDAATRGLFTYGPTGLNKWTGSPADTTFGLPYGGRLTWSSDPSSIRIQGSPTAWRYDTFDFSAAISTRTSGMDCIVVRTYTP